MVVQLVRMLPCHGRGRGFESRPARLKPFPIFLEGLFYFMLFYVYIIQSEKDDSFYKGFSLQPLLRLAQHNNKESTYTANKIPWKLFHLEIFGDKKAALKREIALKKYSHQQIIELSLSAKNQLQLFLLNN